VLRTIRPFESRSHEAQRAALVRGPPWDLGELAREWVVLVARVWLLEWEPEERASTFKDNSSAERASKIGLMGCVLSRDTLVFCHNTTCGPLPPTFRRTVADVLPPTLEFLPLFHPLFVRLIVLHCAQYCAHPVPSRLRLSRPRVEQVDSTERNYISLKIIWLWECFESACPKRQNLRAIGRGLMKVNLLLAYETNGRAVSLGRVRDPRMIRQAAQQAIAEKRKETARILRSDAGLGVVAVEELGQMRRTLMRLIPDFVA
jgi:hypothetical protein